MIKVIVKSNFVRKEVTAELTQTPQEIFSNLGIDPAGASQTLNGSFLSAVQLNTPFESLDIQDGSVAYLSSIVKADGANK